MLSGAASTFRAYPGGYCAYKASDGLQRVIDDTTTMQKDILSLWAFKADLSLLKGLSS